MMLKTFILLALLIPGQFPAPKNVSSDALGAVQYEVRYKLGALDTKVADATISLEKGKWEQQAVLHSHASIRASSIFRLFLNAEYIADAYLTPGGQEPVYSFNPIKKGGKEGKFACTYDRKAKTITTEFVKPPADPVTQTLPLDGKTMDMLSLLQYVRFQNFKAGESRSLRLMMGANTVSATLNFQGADTERFPGVKAERFVLKMVERGLMENGSGSEITVWRSAGADRRILGLETALSSGVMVAAVKE